MRRSKTPRSSRNKSKSNYSPRNRFERLSRGKPTSRSRIGAKHLQKIALEKYKKLPEY
jgi:hypothetical protein